jgi:phthiodiolone/phenolphthiodiolone dimycocerosates ketoreductase
VHLLYDDDEQLDRLLNNPLMKFHAACFGRLNHSQWREEGFDLIFPTDWHYSTKLLPAQLSQSEINRIVDQVTPERVERSYIVGTPAEAAEEVAAYIEAGATFIAPFDMCAAALRPDEQEDAVSRMLEVCGIIKGAKQSA